MKRYADEFVDPETFTMLNQRMLKRYTPIYDQGNLKINGQKPDTKNLAVRLRATSENNDYIEAAGYLGKEIIPVINKCREYLISLGVENPVAKSIWFQYMTNTYILTKHHDSNVRQSTLENSYSTFLYCHDIWDNSWGGELCFNDEEIPALPNRLIAYSRDEEHWVNPIKHDNQDYKRMFFGISWSSI